MTGLSDVERSAVALLARRIASTDVGTPEYFERVDAMVALASRLVDSRTETPAKEAHRAAS